MRSSSNIVLTFHRLAALSLPLVCYVDARDINSINGNCQVGFVILLEDEENQCCILSYASRRSRLLAHSTITGEALAFAEDLDCSYAIGSHMMNIIGHSILLTLLTDSEILFLIITRRKTTIEGLSMVHLIAVKATYPERDISNVAFTASEFTQADKMTKRKLNDALRKILTTGDIDHPVCQYIIENNA